MADRPTTRAHDRLPASASVATVRANMSSHTAWRYFSEAGAWICPYCLTVVNKRPGVNAMEMCAGHLDRCPSYHYGRGQIHPEPVIAARLRLEQISVLALNDRAFQVYDHEMLWWCPGCLGRVPTVRRPADGKANSFSQRAILEHAGQCQGLHEGRIHAVESVIQAAEQGSRLISAEQAVRSQIAFPSWRYTDVNGAWICPCCLQVEPAVVLRGATTQWDVASLGMAKHLALTCGAVRRSGRIEPQAETVLRDTAAALAPGRVSGPMGDPSRFMSMKTPLHSAAMQRSDPTPRRQSQSISNPGRELPKDLPVARPLSGANQGNSQGTSQGNVNTGDTSRNYLPTVSAVPAANVPVKRGGTEPLPLPEWMQEPAAPDPKPVVAKPQEPSIKEQSSKGPSGKDSADKSASTKGGDHLDWMDAAERTIPPDEAEVLERTDVLRARDLQEHLLSSVPVVPGFKISTEFEACAEVSGDFYAFIPHADGRLTFAVGDVSGHGVQAGLVMSMARKTLEIFAGLGLGPADTLSKVNDALVGDLGGRLFVSMVYGVLDPENGSIVWARAGHPPPIILRADGSFEDINPKGMVVGMKAGPMFRKSLTEVTCQLEPGDVVLLYTDGITEAMNHAKEEFGEDRLKAIMCQSISHGSERMLEEIMNRVRGFHGGSAPDDDLTLLAVHRIP